MKLLVRIKLETLELVLVRISAAALSSIMLLMTLLKISEESSVSNGASTSPRGG